MKTASCFLPLLAVVLLCTQTALAQGYGGGYRPGDARSRYGARPGPTTPTQPAAPMTPARPTPGAPPAAPPSPVPPSVARADVVRFSQLATNAAFFFLTDTNRSFLWVKISPTTASNTVNQKVATIPAAVLVKAEPTVAQPPARTAPAPGPAAEMPAPAPPSARPPVPAPPAAEPRAVPRA